MLPSIRLICKSVHFSQSLHSELESYGLTISENAEYTILVESSLGTAVTELEESNIDPHKTIVFTPNPCFEYWQDVLELSVQGLVMNSLNQHTVISALNALVDGQPFRHLPQTKHATLTLTERSVLKFVAHSFSNKDIADILEKNAKTITNSITCILNKLSATYPELRLNNRSCLVHYYYGFWNNITKNCKWSKIAKKNRSKKRE